jgi:hypothetical protein
MVVEPPGLDYSQIIIYAAINPGQVAKAYIRRLLHYNSFSPARGAGAK